MLDFLFWLRLQTSLGMYAHTETQTQPKLSYITSATFHACLAIINNEKHNLYAQALKHAYL